MGPAPSRRRATVADLVPWLAEVGATLRGAAAAAPPGAAIDPRTRERVIVAVAECEGSRWCAFVHGAWADFLGDGVHDEIRAAVVDHARRCAEAGRPVDPGELASVLPPDAVAAIRATVARAELSSLVANSVESLADRIRRRRLSDPVALLRELGVAAVAGPAMVPWLAVGALLGGVVRVAPSVPEVTMPPAGRANLLTHLLADAAPGYLANAAVRSVVLGLPFAVPIGVRAGRTSATITLGRGGVEVRNGITDDAWLVVEGEVEPLLRAASGEIVRQAGAVRIRPKP